MAGLSSPLGHVSGSVEVALEHPLFPQQTICLKLLSWLDAFVEVHLTAMGSGSWREGFRRL